MKSSVTASLLAAACVLTPVAAQNTLDTATAELNQIKTLTDNLTTTIRNWDGQVSGLTPIVTQNAGLVTYINNATEQLKSVPTVFTTTDSFDIGAPTQYLAYAVNGSIAALIHQRSLFNASGLNSTVVMSLGQQLNASKSFSAVLLSYVPQDVYPVAASLNEQIVLSLQQGIQCFSQNVDCYDAVANSSRTYDAAVDSGAIKPIKNAAEPRSVVGGAAVAVALAVAAFAL